MRSLKIGPLSQDGSIGTVRHSCAAAQISATGTPNLGAEDNDQKKIKAKRDVNAAENGGQGKNATDICRRPFARGRCAMWLLGPQKFMPSSGAPGPKSRHSAQTKSVQFAESKYSDHTNRHRSFINLGRPTL